MNNRIYPVPVKPRSQINDWSGWPDDVREIIRSWNKDREVALSFVWLTVLDVFKCVDCEAFCERHPHGAATFKQHDIVCDDCLIARARATL